MPSKKRSLIRKYPVHSETESLRVNHDQVPSETSQDRTQPQNTEEYVYDSDEDETVVNQKPTLSSSSTGTLAPIVLGNTVTENREPIVSDNRVETQVAPIVLGNPVTNTTAPIVSGNPVTNSALTISEAANIMDQQILQMGNVVQNDPPIAKRAVEHTLNKQSSI